MKRWILALIPWIGMAGTAWGQTRFVEVAYTHLGSTPQRAFRVGDECFVTLETAKAWNWVVQIEAGQAKISAEGKSIDLPLRLISGQQAFPVRQAIEKLGGVSEWTLGGDTLEVASVLSEVELKPEKLILRATLGAKVTTFLLTDPDRLVVDIQGARLPTGGLKALPAGIRASQHKPNTVRIIREGTAVQLPVLPTDMAATFELPLTPVVGPDSLEKPVEPEQPVVPSESPAVPPGIMSLSLVRDTNKEMALALAGKFGKAPLLAKPSPDVLEVKLVGTFARLPEDFVLESPSVVGTSTRVEKDGTVLVLTLSRPMGAEVWADGNGLQIQLLKPTVGDGKLAGKIIIVDPGHGGHDSGAHRSGVSEKNIVLAVAKDLAENLKREGATVIMTRKTDVFIELEDRGPMALRNKADFFISVHVNSTVGKNKKSGTITFHHLGNQFGKLLGECVQREIAKVSGLPGIGTWSDGKIYDSGFRVLRDTKSLPGVLVELGFVNHDKDRKRLVERDFQTKVAAAIAKGIKVYLGDGK